MNKQHWIFDLDGTLTRAVHDFPAIKRSLGLPEDRGILEVMAEMGPRERGEVAKALEDIEYAYAEKAKPALGVFELLSDLKERGAVLGILTRNSRPIALATLKAAGLSGYFDHKFVLGRDEAEPKPSPEGVLRLLRDWQADPETAVMVGDSFYDIGAGRAAGVATIYVGLRNDHGTDADLRFNSLGELLENAERSR